MLPPEEHAVCIRKFAEGCDFRKGLLALDLDGTALLEDRGKVFISSSVEKAVKAIHDLNRPVVLNTLRFPLSVMNTIGEAWYQIANTPILTVLLNGSIVGYIVRAKHGLEYQELISFPLTPEEIEGMLTGISELLADGIHDLLLFFYSRDWREGEALWTIEPSRTPELKAKYVSASRVISGSLDSLRGELLGRDICMTCLFIDRPQDTLMAYQHGKRNNFFTAQRVDKAFGIRTVAKQFDLSLKDSLGAGDTEMDNFLSELGLAMIVGDAALPYRGLVDTVRVDTPLELGDLLLLFAQLVEAKGSA